MNDEHFKERNLTKLDGLKDHVGRVLLDAGLGELNNKADFEKVLNKVIDLSIRTVLNRVGEFELKSEEVPKWRLISGDIVIDKSQLRKLRKDFLEGLN